MLTMSPEFVQKESYNFVFSWNYIYIYVTLDLHKMLRWKQYKMFSQMEVWRWFAMAQSKTHLKQIQEEWFWRVPQLCFDFPPRLMRRMAFGKKNAETLGKKNPWCLGCWWFPWWTWHLLPMLSWEGFKYVKYLQLAKKSWKNQHLARAWAEFQRVTLTSLFFFEKFRKKLQLHHLPGMKRANV